MGRANYVILALGIASLFILSLLMKHLLQVTEGHARSPVADGLLAAYGDRLETQSKIVIDETSRGPQAVVSIEPVVGTPMQAFAREVGEYVWEQLGESRKLTSVVVMCRTWAQGGSIRIQVPRPAPKRALAPRPAAAAPLPAPAAVVAPAPPTQAVPRSTPPAEVPPAPPEKSAAGAAAPRPR